MDRLEHLLSFVRSVEAGDFTAAGRLLSISPSAVSKQIARLEDHLKVRLFNRSSRVLNLTPEGQALYERSIQILDLVEDTEAVVSGSSAEPRGLLRVHVSPVFSIYKLTQLTRDYVDLYPQVRIEYVLENQAVDIISAGIDIAIQRGRLKDSAYVARKVATSRWTVCASPEYLARRGTPLQPADLLTHTCLNISVRPELKRWPFASTEDCQHVATNGPISANSGELLRHLAIAGTGIVRLAEFHVEADIQAGRLVPLLLDWPGQPETFYAIYLRRKNMSARVRTYLDFLFERLRS